MQQQKARCSVRAHAHAALVSWLRTRNISTGCGPLGRGPDPTLLSVMLAGWQHTQGGGDRHGPCVTTRPRGVNAVVRLAVLLL